MKVFITGGSGMLGSALSFHFSQRWVVFAGYESNRISINSDGFHNVKIDVTDVESLSKIKETEPDVVIHAAALTNLEYCEEHLKRAHEVNVVGTRNVVRICNEIDAKVVYISTDYVFDGRRGNYTEKDKPNPLSVYARTKLEGERVIRSKADDYLIIRTSFHGWNPNPNKFSVSSWIVKSLKRGQLVKAAVDQRNSPLFTLNLAEIIETMLRRDFHGLYNVGSSDSVSRYELALGIAEIFKLNMGLIEPVIFKEIQKAYKLYALRPKDVSLKVEKVERELGRMPTIQDGLKKMRNMEREFKKKIVLESLNP